MSEYLVRPLADAFLQVGVFVAALVVLFGWLRWKYQTRVTDLLDRHRRLGPLMGATLGVSPGCGGAILVMPLYARGSVSFGTVVAALVATMGDSSWIIMAADPLFALQLHAMLFVVGLLTGGLVDAVGYDPRRRKPPEPAGPAHPAPGTVSRPTLAEAVPAFSRPRPALVSMLGMGPDMVLVPPVAVLRAVWLSAFWACAAVGLLVAVPVAFQLGAPAGLVGAFSGWDPYLVVGSVGSVIAIGVVAGNRGRFCDDTQDTATPSSFSAVLRHGARETSFVTAWVAVAYVVVAAVSGVTGFDGSQLAVGGLVGVAAGALLGLVPGCALPIVVTGMYAAGGLPTSTLVANALSQDGDALLPLLTLERRSAVVASAITTVPALLVGGLALLVL